MEVIKLLEELTIEETCDETKLCKYLDKIDLLKDINEFKGKNLLELMDHLEEKYDDKLFNCFDDYSLMSYLNRRYGNVIEEETEVILRIKSSGGIVCPKEY